MSNNIKQLAETLVSLTIKEINDLAKILKNDYGIEPPNNTIGVAPKATKTSEEQKNFDVILTYIGNKKLAIVKLVKELTGMGLKESKDLVDSVPKPLKKGISKSEAESIKIQLEEIGAKVEIK